MAENDDTVGETACGITYHFDMMSEGIRNELCLKLADKKTAARDVSEMIAHIFGRLPENVRNESLLKLADKEEAAFHIAMTVAINFDKLAGSIQNIIFKLADNKAGYMVYALAHYYDELPKNVQNIIFKMVDNEETAWHVNNVVSWTSGLPDDIRDQLSRQLKLNKYSA